MILDGSRKRVGKRADHRRVGRLVEVGGIVGVEEGIRLVHGHLDGEHVAGGGGGIGRDAVLAQPAGDGLDRLCRRSDVLLDLKDRQTDVAVCRLRDERWGRTSALER